MIDDPLGPGARSAVSVLDAGRSPSALARAMAHSREGMAFIARARAALAPLAEAVPSLIDGALFGDTLGAVSGGPGGSTGTDERGGERSGTRRPPGVALPGANRPAGADRPATGHPHAADTAPNAPQGPTGSDPAGRRDRAAPPPTRQDERPPRAPAALLARLAPGPHPGSPSIPTGGAAPAPTVASSPAPSGTRHLPVRTLPGGRETAETLTATTGARAEARLLRSTRTGRPRPATASPRPGAEPEQPAATPGSDHHFLVSQWRARVDGPAAPSGLLGEIARDGRRPNGTDPRGRGGAMGEAPAGRPGTASGGPAARPPRPAAPGSATTRSLPRDGVGTDTAAGAGPARSPVGRRGPAGSPAAPAGAGRRPTASVPDSADWPESKGAGTPNAPDVSGLEANQSHQAFALGAANPEDPGAEEDRLDRLAEDVGKILVEEARRHGLDV